MIQFGYMPDTHGGPYDQPEPTPERSADFAAQLLDEAAQAERYGFDAVFVPERHARTECMFPSPLPLMAAIAARTTRVKIGTDIMMPPLYNPVDLAQSTALIDVLSRGRLILGVGVGYHPRYFAHFGVPIRQREGRFEETLEVLQKAWTMVGPFAHHGKYFNFDAIHVTPKPFQRPRPPIWIGAFGPKSIARAGRLADGWTMAPFLDSTEAIKTNVAIYREAAAKAGKKPYISLFRDGWLANSRDEAEQTFGKLWLEEWKFYTKWGMLEEGGDPSSASYFSMDKLRNYGYPIMGNAADWLEALDRWDRIVGGLDSFVLRVRVPMGPSKEKVMECIQRLGEEVLPQFRKRQALTES
jgi:alkanesulfonate monooxygenase SsuD/methylene tetrahydromethanopterin reductase-like flavin-dependent oxidoreductase (luciferase family)